MHCILCTLYTIYTTQCIHYTAYTLYTMYTVHYTDHVHYTLCTVVYIYTASIYIYLDIAHSVRCIKYESDVTVSSLVSQLFDERDSPTT